MTRNTITRSCSTSSFKRFDSKDLGRPPSHSNHVHINFLEKPVCKLTNTTQPIKIAPMREIEKMITDLKKENFDLKLRLFHLEEMMTKEAKRANLERKTRPRSIGTQTILFESTPEAFGLSSFKKDKKPTMKRNENINSVVIALENIKIDNNNSSNWFYHHPDQYLTSPLF